MNDPAPASSVRYRGPGRHRYTRPSRSQSRGSSRTPRAEGSLLKASQWTALGSIIPGLGLLPTRRRTLGRLLLAIVSITVLGLVAAGIYAMASGDTLTTVFNLGTYRPFLIAALVTVIVVGLGWIATIVMTNYEHNVRERLSGAAKVASMALAYVFILLVALPTTHTAHSLWAAQQLIGNNKVFGGGGDDDRLTKGPDPWKGTERVNIMLLGQDAGADRTGTRPDTIMVASIDTKTGRTALFSIPRNLQYVEFPKGSAPAKQFPDGFTYYGRNQNLINAVWAWAAEVRPDLFPDDPNPGLTATTMAVEETLGLTIDYYAMVNLQGFQDLVDAIGGVDIEVERDIPIGGGNSKVEGYIKKGQQKLNGYQALWYARSRHGSSDFDRNCRQQRIVRTVADEANVTKVVLAMPRLIGATERNIETDIPSSRLEAFADLAMRIQKGGFKSYPINPSVTPSGNPDYPYLEKWVQASIADSMEGAVPVNGAETTIEATPSAAPSTTASNEPSSSQATGPTEETSAPAAEESPSVESTTQPPAEAAKPKSTDETTVVVNKDPLAACMPGNEDPIN